jgi:hypothetical protein
MPDWMTSVAAVIAVLLAVAQIVMCVLALGVFPGSRKPSTAMAWLILVLALPYLGFVVFLLSSGGCRSGGSAGSGRATSTTRSWRPSRTARTTPTRPRTAWSGSPG